MRDAATELNIVYAQILVDIQLDQGIDRPIERIRAYADQRVERECDQAQAQAAALRLGLNEAVMTLDDHGIPVPQSTRQCLVVHGGAHYAGEALLAEIARLRVALKGEE